jgi:hypothetical protein
MGIAEVRGAAAAAVAPGAAAAEDHQAFVAFSRGHSTDTEVSISVPFASVPAGTSSAAMGERPLKHQ